MIELRELWNCGVFALKISYLMNLLYSVMKCRCYEDVCRQYGKFERTNFDYAVVEKEEFVAVITCGGEWKNLGIWSTLAEAMEEKPIGDMAISEECRNMQVINELEILIVVAGAQNMIVAASLDSILVSDEEQSSYIKKYVENCDMGSMFEEHSWASTKSLIWSAMRMGRNRW